MIKKLPYIKSIYFDWNIVPIEIKEKYPFNLPLLRKKLKLQLHENVTFIIGENGQGKSTLIEAIANKLGLSSQGGTKNFNLKSNQSNILSEYLELEKKLILPK